MRAQWRRNRGKWTGVPVKELPSREVQKGEVQTRLEFGRDSGYQDSNPMAARRRKVHCLESEQSWSKYIEG